jgi:trimethylamine--corrinoid protein Co-methyltransferase
MTKRLFLNEHQIQSIHQATLRVLNETGVVLPHKKARDLLTGAGGKITEDRVLLPPDLVEEVLALCPKVVKIHGRDGKELAIGDGNLYWHNVGGARTVYNPVTGRTRDATLQDVSDSTRLLDALEYVNSITPFFTPTDVPGGLMTIMMYRTALSNTTKPVQGPGVQTAEEVKSAYRMAQVIGSPDKVLTLSVSPVSPLKFPHHTVESILEIARLGVPFAPLPCPTAGTTAPLSLSGSLTQQNAEVLASIVLAQLVRPGLPIIYCGRLAFMEPRTALSVWGGVELGIASAATVQLAKHYHLPVNVYGLSTNAHTLDLQNGYERSLNAILPALAGADELSGIGEMTAGVAGSFAQMVADNEIAGSVQRICRGFIVDQETLAVDVIAKVMETTQNFIGEKHTVKTMRSGEIYLTQLAERRSWETWEVEGRMGMAERAQKQAEQILAQHEVPPLSEDQERELDEIIEDARVKLDSK